MRMGISLKEEMDPVSERNKFQPKATTCLKCKQAEELKPKDPAMVQCKMFGWLISRELSKTQAVCKLWGGKNDALILSSVAMLSQKQTRKLPLSKRAPDEQPQNSMPISSQLKNQCMPDSQSTRKKSKKPNVSGGNKMSHEETFGEKLNKCIGCLCFSCAFCPHNKRDLKQNELHWKSKGETGENGFHHWSWRSPNSMVLQTP